MRYSAELFAKGKERWLGADSRISSLRNGFRPLYLQYKRPSAYPADSRSAIVKDRESLDPALDTEPRTLFFELRKKKPSHHDFQHNILYRLRRRLQQNGLGDAVYVCPLFLGRSSYRFHVHTSALRRWPFFWRSPFHFGEYDLSANGITELFESIPVFAEHISIAPHELVDTHNHRYSFTESGQQVCFHSPSHLKEGHLPFSLVLAKQFGSLYRTENPGSDAMTRLLRELCSDGDLGFRPDFESVDGEDGWLSQWGAFGEYLAREHSIYQYAIFRTE